MLLASNLLYLVHISRWYSPTFHKLYRFIINTPVEACGKLSKEIENFVTHKLFIEMTKECIRKLNLSLILNLCKSMAINFV